MNVITYALTHIDLFLLILIRMVSFIIVSPLFSMPVFPAWTKIGLAGAVAAVVMPNVSLPSTTLPGLAEFAVLATAEAAIGLLLGWMANLVYYAVTVGGRFLDVEIGLNPAPVLYGIDGSSTSVLEGFQSALFALYFLGMNALDGFVLAMMDSYHFIPIGQFTVTNWTVHFLTALLGVMFELALQFVIPIVCTMLLTDATLAVIARAVPSMNVLFVGLPAKIWLGLSMLAAGMASATYVFGRVFDASFNALSLFLQGWKG